MAGLRDLGLLLLGHVPALGDGAMTAMTETAVIYRTKGRARGSHAVAGTTRPTYPVLRTVDGAGI